MVKARKPAAYKPKGQEIMRAMSDEYRMPNYEELSWFTAQDPNNAAADQKLVDFIKDNFRGSGGEIDWLSIERADWAKMAEGTSNITEEEMEIQTFGSPISDLGGAGVLNEATQYQRNQFGHCRLG